MKKLFFTSMAFIFCTIFLTSSVTRGEKLTIQKLNEAIEESKKRWVADETSKSWLSKEQKQLLCGLRERKFTWEDLQDEISNDMSTGPSKAKKYPRKKRMYGPQNTFSLNNYEPAGLPSFFDWRDIDGQNWISDIRDQGQCGACWAFASLSVMEAMQKIGLHDSYLFTDYSEQFMVSCSEGTCTYGWFLDSSAEFLKSAGAPTEECFPYQAYELPCENRCEDWISLIKKVPDWNWVSAYPQYVNTASIKRKLLRGPLLAGLTVYEDFMHYSHGVYEHVQGEEMGEHAVTIIGWDNKDNCWICKNSWGKNWGDSGWFRIKMGQNECGIEEGLIFYPSPLSWDCEYMEGFEDKIDLPAGWNRKTQNSNYSWKISHFPVFEGSQSISIEYDPDLNYQDEVLLSREFKGQNLTLSFAFMGSYYWGVAENNYQVSVWVVKGNWDAGREDDILITENILKDFLREDDESWIWFPVSYDLPEEVDYSDIRLAFRYQGKDGAQFSMDKICLKGVGAPEGECNCSQEDWGALDIGQGRECVSIRIQNAPGEVNTFGYDVVYDANNYLYNGFERADFFKDFDSIECNEISRGHIHCLGEGDKVKEDNEGKIVPSGYNGTMLTLEFSQINPADEGSGVCLENLTDDIAGWEATNGCLLPYSCSFDVDGNGYITPGDSLCLYEKYLGICPTSCGPCPNICGDVNMDGQCSLSDALLVFHEYLNDGHHD